MQTQTIAHPPVRATEQIARIVSCIGAFFLIALEVTVNAIFSFSVDSSP